LRGEFRHEDLEGGAELLRIEMAEQPAERVVVGQAIPQSQEAAQEWLFRLGEFRHIDHALAAT
jgi:hypothetical protein